MRRVYSPVLKRRVLHIEYDRFIHKVVGMNNDRIVAKQNDSIGRRLKISIKDIRLGEVETHLVIDSSQA